MHELMRLGVLEQARLVRRGEVAPGDLVEAAIASIEALDPTLNAVVLRFFEQARVAARAAPAAAPFRGVPLLLKDMLGECAGTPLTEGSRFLRGFVCDTDSELVARWRRAGFVIVGRTNSPEFASKPTTEPEFYGATHNPWDRARTPGGSSGGAAAAVAAGMVAVAHANDGGGSIRVPAACCGVVGLKPTRGRNPSGPGFGDIGAAGLLCEHVVTRSVLDCAVMLDVSAGADHGAPHYPPAPARAFAAEVGVAPGRLRIAFSETPVTDTPVHADCRAAVREAAALLTDLGHDVEEAKPRAAGAARFGEWFTTVWLAMVAWIIRDWSRRTGRVPAPEHFERHTWKMFSLDEARRPSDLLLAIHDMQCFAREVAPFFDTYDLWLTPTLSEPPPPLGWFDYDPADPPRATARLEAFPRFTAFANVTGQPAISLPLCWRGDGLPLGVQLIGRYADEATVLRVAAQLEQARPWAQRWPTLDGAPAPRARS